MATIIDALVMTLGLDTRDFTKNEKGASEQLDKFKKQSNSVAKDVANGGKAMAEGFKTIRNELIGLFAVLTAGRGLKNFITEGVTGMAELGRKAQDFGMTAKELDSWGAAAESVGGSAAEMQSSIQNLASGIEEFKLTHQGAIMPVFRRLGIAVNEDGGKLRSYSAILTDIADRFSKMSRQDALAFGHMLGLDDHTIYLLEQGAQGLSKLRAEMEKNSGVTDKGVEEAQRIQAAWAGFHRQVKGLSDTLFMALEPAMRPIIKTMTDWISKNHSLISSKVMEWAKKFAAWLPGFVRELSNLATKIQDIVQAMGGWKTVGIAVGGIMALKILAPVLSLAGGLTRLIPLIASTTAGLTSMAVAGAAVFGWKVGSMISNQIEGTKAGDWVGRGLAQTAAALGSDEAKKAVIRDNWSRMSADERKRRIAAYQALTPSERAIYDQAAPEAASLMKAASGMPKGRPLPRGVRNRNPGNLNYVGQAGAHLESGPNARFAAFDTQEEGIAALIDQLGKYAARGNDTIAGIVNKYAPAADNNNVSAYIASLTKATGKKANEHLDLSDLGTLIPLVQGIVRHEGNGNLSADDIMRGIRVGAQQRLASRGGASRVSTSTAETHIGTVQVVTQATDAKGIARDMGRELRRNVLVAGANGGAA